jgi:hypothetical protein
MPYYLHELYYKLAKDYFVTEEQINEEIEDFSFHKS